MNSKTDVMKSFNRKYFLLVWLALLPALAWSQCFRNNLNQGKGLMVKKEYNKAIECFTRAKKCSDFNNNPEADRLIAQCNNLKRAGGESSQQAGEANNNPPRPTQATRPEVTVVWPAEPIEMVNLLLDAKIPEYQRIKLVDQVAARAFASSDVVVESYADESQSLLLEAEKVKQFLTRLATTSSTARVVELESELNANNQFVILKVYEAER